MSDENTTRDLQNFAGKPEAFPLPRTMPANWDLSMLASSDLEHRSFPKPASRGHRRASSPPAKNGRAGTLHQLEKPSESFPEPRTFPGNWDLSD